jgi:hypothetical protein
MILSALLLSLVIGLLVLVGQPEGFVARETVT